eukprot:TRINITY_DN12266_c0_g2_i1.p1 TRINITY_DN12266_c0_g2~~TRINITY_DN12266_c0_g2_i1.p1  ORF type:complete len:729 (+),score=146.67 TRINITY_DN12266_c0_g2_i1:142-2328(+)
MASKQLLVAAFLCTFGQTRRTVRVGSEEQRLQLAKLDSRLRVFAGTFNAGNQKYKGSEGSFTELAEAMLRGHDSPDKEADLVVLGFQEIGDEGHRFGEAIRTQHLWKRSTQVQVQALRQEVSQLVDIPVDVVKERKSLIQHLETYHQRAHTAVKEFLSQYGEQNDKFFSELAKKSPVHKLKDEATRALNSVNNEPTTNLAESVVSTMQDSDTRFEALDESIRRLHASVEKFPTQDEINDKLKLADEWSAKTRGKLQDVEHQFPNMVYTRSGQDAWQRHMKRIGSTDAWKDDLLSMHQAMRTHVTGTASDFMRTVRQNVWDKEASIANSLVQDWKQARNALDKLQQDLNDLIANDNLVDDLSGGKVAQHAMEASLSESIDKWSWMVKSHGEKLLQTDRFGLDESSVDIKSDLTHFDSGKRCASFNHLDTKMYVFVNPWSEWKISSVPYSSATCIKSDRSNGCSINNGGTLECGKVVNFARFKAQRDGMTTTFCAMNTHMSFKGTAEDRLLYLIRAINEAKEAHCEDIVFVGDFNSRLHCELAGSKANVPFYEDPGNSGSSFRNILSKYCSGSEGSASTCRLGGSAEKYRDELAQMVSNDTVHCLEKAKKDGLFRKREATWELDSFSSMGVKNYGLKEAAEPNFAPSYKYENVQKAKDADPRWRQCFDGEVNCLSNKQMDGKHNPSWTDRVLVRSRSGFQTEVYERRPINGGGLSSDHIPVIAQLSLDVR